MSCAPREECTECHVVCRTADVRHFSLCRHRVCKRCLSRCDEGGVASRTRRAKDECPVCDESRRRLGLQVRSKIWSEETVKLVCVDCGHHGAGAYMKCGHSYCTPCLRKLPRSSQSRDLHGEMAKGCRDCEEKAAEEARDATRAAMRAADAEARIARDERDLQDFRRDSQLLKQRGKKSKAPPVPAPAPVVESSAPAASKPACKRPGTAAGAGAGAKAGAKAPNVAAGSAAAAIASASGASRKVTFDPLVQQRFISPLPEKRRTRRSLPAGSVPARPDDVPQSMFAAVPWPTTTSLAARRNSSTAALRLSGAPGWLVSSCGSGGLNPSGRGWGIMSP